MINSSVGGTPIEAWTTWKRSATCPRCNHLRELGEENRAFDPAKTKAIMRGAKRPTISAAAKAKAEGKPVGGSSRRSNPRIDAHRPVNLFNGKIAPLIPFAIRGAIWYQGESNATNAASGLAYRKQCRCW